MIQPDSRRSAIVRALALVACATPATSALAQVEWTPVACLENRAAHALSSDPAANRFGAILTNALIATVGAK